MNETERLLRIWQRTVEALGEVVREFNVTEEELHLLGRFLNRVGHQDVGPSLVDVALAMRAVDVAGENSRLSGTHANLEGPFYRPGAPVRADGNLLEREPSPHATRLTLTCRVVEARSHKPIAGAEIDVWQADERGTYDNEGFHLRGVVITAADGTYAVRAVVPSDYEMHEADAIGDLFRRMGRRAVRAAHIHVKIRVGGRQVLTTQLFMEDSPSLEEDYVVGAVRDDLIVRLRSSDVARARTATFDFVVPRAPLLIAAGITE